MIFVVEDDPNIRELVTYTLQSTGFDACGFENGSEFLKALSDGEKPELVLLDIMLPGEDGISILGKLRKKSATRDLPIIMMTAKGTEYDKVLGLDSGADDYITKPFNPLEVMARVKSLLRRTKMTAASEQPDILEVRSLIINRDSHEVKTLDGGDIQLTALEFGILYLLASHPNRVFSADEIFERVWKQESVVSAKTVMVHVSHLRDKIEEATGGEKIIQTVWGVGYKIDAK